MAAILSELSMCFLQIFAEILLSLHLILEKNFSQMYVLPESNDMSKVWLWNEEYFSLVREGL